MTYPPQGSLTIRETGPKGDKGDRGDSIKGDKGDRGEKGDSIRGEKGERGERGERGESIKGDKGDTGESPSLTILEANMGDVALNQLKIIDTLETLAANIVELNYLLRSKAAEEAKQRELEKQTFTQIQNYLAKWT